MGGSVCGCDWVGVGVIVWVGVGVITWVRKECVGGTVLIAAVKYVCVSGEWGGVCVGVTVWVWV